MPKLKDTGRTGLRKPRRLRKAAMGSGTFDHRASRKQVAGSALRNSAGKLRVRHRAGKRHARAPEASEDIVVVPVSDDRTDVAALRAMSEAEVHAAALSDPDARPLTRAQLLRMKPLPDPDVRALRERLGLSQSEFSLRYGIELKTLQDWEQGRRKPAGPVRVLLRMIATHPKAVERAAKG